MALSTITKVCLVAVLCTSFMTTSHHEVDAQFSGPEILSMIDALSFMPTSTMVTFAERAMAYVWNNYKDQAISYMFVLKPYIAMLVTGDSSVMWDLLARLPGILNDTRTVELVKSIVDEMTKVNFTQLNSTSFLSTAISILETIDVGNIWSKIQPFIDLENTISRPQAVTESCYNDTLLAINGLLNGENWALTMLGSFGWPGPGLLRSKLYLAGSSSQCLSVQATSNSTGDIEDVFGGKYCRAKVGIPGALMDIMNLHMNGTMNITMGLCVPDSCQNSDIEALLPTEFLERLGIPVHGVMCTGDIDGIHDDELQGEELIDNLLKSMMSLMNDPRLQKLTGAINREMAKVNFAQLNTKNILSTAISVLEKIDVANIWREVRSFIFLKEETLPRPPSVNESCFSDTLLSLNGLLDGEGWAMRMLGSFGWPGPGILRSKLYLAGSSSQCLSVQATSNSTGEIKDVFAGKYCRANVGIPEFLMAIMNLHVNGTMPITTGLCVPDSCQDSDIEALLPTDLIAKVGIPVYSVMCTSDSGGIHDDEMQGEELIDNLLRRMLPLMNDPRLQKITNIANTVLAKVDLTSLETSDPLSMVMDILSRATTFWKIVRPYIDPSAFISQPDSVSSICYQDVIRTANGILDLDRWALTMLDALAKPGPGILQGRLHFVGSHQQCTAVEYFNNKSGQVASFGGQYCRVEMGIIPALFAFFGDPPSHEVNAALGICVPNSCSSQEIKAFLPTEFLAAIKAPIKDIDCLKRPELSEDLSAIACICVLGILVLLAIMGTLYDMCITRRRKEVSEGYAINGYDNTVDVEIVEGFPSFKKAQQQLDAVMNELNKQDTKVRDKKDDVREKETSKYGNRLERCWRSFSLTANIPRVMNGNHAPDNITCLPGIRVISIAWIVLCNTYYVCFMPLKGYQVVSMPRSSLAKLHSHLARVVIDRSLNFLIINFRKTIQDFDSVESDRFLHKTAVRPQVMPANLLVGLDMAHEFTTLAIANGSYAADTFFLISGCVICYAFLGALAKRHGKLKCSHFFYYYLHRFFRLTPAYMVILMLFVCLYRYIGHGPLWPTSIDEAENCRSNWWLHLLYVNNLVSLDTQCMPWTWFMAVLMQFYVVTPIFILFMYFIPIFGLLSTFLLAAGGVAASVVLEMKGAGNLIIPSKDPEIDYMNDIYIKPWCRITPYAVGIMLGFLLYRAKKLRIPKCVSAFCWPIACAILVFVVYVSYTETREGAVRWGDGIRAAYEGGTRVLWSLGVAWVIFACHYGAGGYVQSILAWTAFVPLSRLVYGVFLVHPVLMSLYLYTRGEVVYVTHYTMVYLFLGHLCLSFAAAFLIRVGVEAPVKQLEKALLGGKDTNKNEDEEESENVGYEEENLSYEDEKVQYEDIKYASSQL